MSELSTADLAGIGTTPHAHEREGAVESYDSRRGYAPTGDGEHKLSDDVPQTVQPTSPMSEPVTAAGPSTMPPQDGDPTAARSAPLFPTGEAEGFRSRWHEVQVGFVDDPGTAVEQADSLVAEMIRRLAKVFADERSKIEAQSSRGDNISTEDLRVALRQYRSFFDRLLSV